MLYREIGKTGLQAGIVGMGTEFLDWKPYDAIERTIHTALDFGINIMDVFMPREEIRCNIGKALKGRRDKVILQGHICSVEVDGKYGISRELNTCVKYFENLLRCFETDYIDFGMFFFMDSQEALDEIQNNGIIEYMLEQKQKGTVRYLGASSHNAAIAKKLVDMGLIDLLMFSINAAYDLTGADKDLLEKEEYDFEKALDPQRMELYKLCEKNGVGITVMKSLGAGRLISAELTPFKEPMNVGQCIHYALTRPAVSSVLVGCASPDEVKEAVRYFEMGDDEKNYSHIISDSRSTMKGSCVYCSHCQPCPANIDIAALNKYLDIALLDTDNIPPGTCSRYNELKAYGSDCVSCGNCEQRCPFEVRVIENMQRAVKLFGH